MCIYSTVPVVLLSVLVLYTIQVIIHIIIGTYRYVPVRTSIYRYTGGKLQRVLGIYLYLYLYSYRQTTVYFLKSTANAVVTFLILQAG